MKILFATIAILTALFLPNGQDVRRRPIAPTVGVSCSSLGSQSVTDDFNRANNADLGTNWTPPMRPGNTAMMISSNLAQSGAGTSSEIWNVSTFKDPTGYIQVAGTLATGDQWRLGFNLVDSPGTSTMDGYVVQADKASGTDTIVPNRVTNNAFTALTPSSGTTAQEFVTTDWIGWVRIDSTGEFKICYRTDAGSWTELSSTTDTTYQTAGSVGIGIGPTNARIDNFSIAAH